MSRKFLSDIRQQIADDLPDNTVGAITPALVRGLYTDIMDSTIDLGSEMRRDGILSVSLTTTPTKIAGLFLTGQGSNAGFIDFDLVNQNIIIGTLPNWHYTVFVTFQAQLDNAEDATLLLGLDGSPLVPDRGIFLNSQRNGNVISGTIYYDFIDSVGGDRTLQVFLSTNNAGTYDISQTNLRVVAKPTETP